MKTQEHIYAIKNLMSHGMISDDFSYSNSLILHFLEVARAKLIEEKANKYFFISEQSFQSLCIDMEKGSFHNCCSGPEENCLLKSKEELPKTISVRFGTFIKVMDLYGNVISQGSPTLNKYFKFSITGKKAPMWFIHDNRLYILNNNSLDKVLINGIFSTPSQPIETACTNGETALCVNYLDSEFPIDADLIDPMYKLTLTYLSLQNNKDEKNDSTDNLSVPQPQRGL